MIGVRVKLKERKRFWSPEKVVGGVRVAVQQ